MNLIPFSTRRSGALHESKALKFLQKNGYSCVDRNFTSRFGEIDLIVIKPGEVLVFVEVRYRQSSDFGSPAETVTYTKQVRLRKTASCYLLRHQAYNALPCRFDVIAISDCKTGKLQKIEWTKNAFY